MTEFLTISEIAVTIRSTPEHIGAVATPTLAPTPVITPETLPVTFTDTSNCCEDCPDANDNPPDSSECPYFEHEAGKWPVCKREGNSDEVISKLFGFNR